MGFRKAERRQVKLKLALAGPAGSGKTMSGLRLAFGIGTKVAGVDSENETMSLYSDKFPPFEVLNLKPPYTTEKYIEAIKLAEKSGFDILLIDGISAAWSGTGGLLEEKEKLDARGGKQNRFANWASITKKQEAFMAAILQSNIHIICTMRAKTEYESTEDGKVKKLGLAPVQREGVDYEFTTIFDIDMAHNAQASKDRTGLFGDAIFQISEDTGKRFTEWLGSALPAQWAIQRSHLEAVTQAAQAGGWTNIEAGEYVKRRFGKENVTKLLQGEYEAFLQVLKTSKPKEAMEKLQLVDQQRHEAEGAFANTEPELKQ